MKEGGVTVRFAGKVALVTGGSSGIGGAVAEKLTSEGAHCAIISRDARKAEAFMARLPDRDKAAWWSADVSDWEQVRQTVEQAAERFGKIDLLVNAAGINIRKPALEYAPQEWKRILDINLTGTFYVCQCAGKIMKETGGGSIVNIGSMTSHFGVPHVAPYAASKGGVMQLTKALAVEWAPYGIRVNQVSPGYIETPLASEVVARKKYRERIIERTPLGRWGTPQDVVSAVAFLLSDESEFITGQIFGVDGGILGGDPSMDPLQE